MPYHSTFLPPGLPLFLHLQSAPSPAAHGMVQVSKPLGFIERHGLWSDDERRLAEQIKRRCETENLQLIRLAWADPHGASRAKAVTVPAFVAALETGYNINV